MWYTKQVDFLLFHTQALLYTFGTWSHNIPLYPISTLLAMCFICASEFGDRFNLLFYALFDFGANYYSRARLAIASNAFVKYCRWFLNDRIQYFVKFKIGNFFNVTESLNKVQNMSQQGVSTAYNMHGVIFKARRHTSKIGNNSVTL